MQGGRKTCISDNLDVLLVLAGYVLMNAAFLLSRSLGSCISSNLPSRKTFL